MTDHGLNGEKKVTTKIIHNGSDPNKHYGSINIPIYKNSTEPNF